jgi:hypothetical protein
MTKLWRSEFIREAFYLMHRIRRLANKLAPTEA